MKKYITFMSTFWFTFLLIWMACVCSVVGDVYFDEKSENKENVRSKSRYEELYGKPTQFAEQKIRKSKYEEIYLEPETCINLEKEPIVNHKKENAESMKKQTNNQKPNQDKVSASHSNVNTEIQNNSQIHSFNKSKSPFFAIIFVFVALLAFLESKFKFSSISIQYVFNHIKFHSETSEQLQESLGKEEPNPPNSPHEKKPQNEVIVSQSSIPNSQNFHQTIESTYTDVLSVLEQVNVRNLNDTQKMEYVTAKLAFVRTLQKEKEIQNKEDSVNMRLEQENRHFTEKMQLELFHGDLRLLHNLFWFITVFAFGTWFLSIQKILQDLIPIVAAYWKQAFCFMMEMFSSGTGWMDNWYLKPVETVYNLLASIAVFILCVFLLYLMVKLPRLGSFCILFTVFHIFWHSILRLLVLCIPIYALSTLSFIIITTSFKKLSSARLIGHWVTWIVCLAASVLIGLYAIKGDPLNPDRDIYFLEIKIESLISNYIKNVFL